jgi:asparagine synthase (glutamine-hydrolysing)
MCGIFASNDPLVSSSHKRILNKHLKFRGPDFQSGLIKYKNWRVYHARLAIIGLKNKYNQPYVCPDGSILLFNGEIFNFKEIALANLKIKKIESDTDLLSKIIIKKNFDYNKLDGFFSIIRISKNGKLLNCARDPFGVKPLFYYKRKKFITICSEPIVIKKIFNLKINSNALREYSLFRAPIFSKSFFKNIKIVEPGNCLVKGVHFNLLEEFLLKKNKKKNLDLVLKRNMNKRILSDAKIGLLLSGGIDSNIIRNLIPKTDYFCGGFKSDFDYQYLIKEKLKVNFVNFKNSTFVNRLKKLINLRGEPLSVPNEVVLSLLAKEAKKRKIKVLISGEGADEFFGGYDRIFNWAIKEKFTIEKFCEFYCYNKIIKNSQEYLNLKIFFNKLKKLSSFNKVKYFFIKIHLPILLRRLDFALMSEGIEGREPFLSKEIFQESMKYKKTELIDKNIGKIPLRNIAKRYFGEDFASFKKVGFPIDMSKIVKYRKKGFISNYNLWFRLNKKMFMELK